MKKVLYILFFVFSAVTFAAEDGFGIINDNELKEVGVSSENIKKAKNLMASVESSYKLKVLEKTQLELKVNQYVLEGAEKNLDKIDKIFEQIGNIETEILKERIRSQIQIQKYISQDQYIKAKEKAIRRLNTGFN